MQGRVSSVKCKWCAEKSAGMEKHGEHMKKIATKLLKKHVGAEASALKRTNGDAAQDKTKITFEPMEAKRLKKQVSFGGVTAMVQLTDTDHSRNFKKEMKAGEVDEKVKELAGEADAALKKIPEGKPCLENLSKKAQEAVALAATYAGICSRCRWSAGCLSCSKEKALKYWLKREGFLVETVPMKAMES